MSLKAYTQAQKITGSPRDNEYRLFGQVTRALIEAQKLANNEPAFFEALDWNRRMWSAFSSDCGLEGNKLPRELRAQIISISIWVSKYTSMVALGRADMDALIDINKTIMEGLAPKG